jgi:hypothetical protein
MSYKVLPIPYKEYLEPDITFDCINSGLDPVVGTAGLLEFGTNASEHSSFQRASYETHKIWNKEFHGISYTSDGKVAYKRTEANWKEWIPTGTKTWKQGSPLDNSQVCGETVS